MVRNKVMLVVLLSAFCLTAMVANADVIGNLRLADNNGNSITLTDNGACVATGTASCGAGDLNPLAGATTWSGSIGTWVVNVSTGLVSPILPLGKMDINSTNANIGAPSSISIYWSMTGMTGSGGAATTSIGGTNSNTTTAYQAWFDDGDAAFGLTNLIASLGPFAGAGYSGSGGGDIVATGPYSVTQVVTLAAGSGFSNASFDAQLQIPEPASMSMLGAGLIGLAGLLRRKLVK